MLNYKIYEEESYNYTKLLCEENNGILLNGNIECKNNFYVIEFMVKGDKKIICAATSSEIYKPLIQAVKEDIIIIGIENNLYFIDLNSLKILKLIENHICIFEIIEIEKEKKFLIIYEIYIYMISIDGDIIWDSNFDIIGDWNIKGDIIEIKELFEDKIKIVSLLDGSIIE